MTNESGISGEISEKIRSVRASENTINGDRGGDEGVRDGGEGDRRDITSNVSRLASRTGEAGGGENDECVLGWASPISRNRKVLLIPQDIPWSRSLSASR